MMQEHTNIPEAVAELDPKSGLGVLYRLVYFPQLSAADIPNPLNQPFGSQLLRDAASTALEEVLSQINCDRVAKGAREITQIGQELQYLHMITVTNPSRASVYSSQIQSALDRGNHLIAQLVKEFRDSDLELFIELVSTKIVRDTLGLTIEALPEAERRLLRRVGLEENESAIISKLLESISNEDGPSFLSLMDASAERIAQLAQQIDTQRISSRKFWQQLAGAYRVCTGTGLVGLNAVGFSVTGGLIISWHAAISSMLVGTTFVVDGSKQLAYPD